MTSPQNAGQLGNAINRIRVLADDPTVRDKYSDTDLINYMCEGWQEVLGDLYGFAQNAPLTRYTITIDQNTEFYNLPATVGEVRYMAHRDATGRLVWECVPASPLNPFEFGVRFHGTQRLQLGGPATGNFFLTGTTLEIGYVPSGTATMHRGTAAKSAMSSNSLTLALGGSDIGEIDRRSNAYLGSYIGIVDYNGTVGSEGAYSWVQFPIQQRIIDTYNVNNRQVTVTPNWDFDPALLTTGTSFTYEVYPIEAPVVWPMLTLWVARKLAMQELQEKRYQLLDRAYQESKRACMLKWSRMETRRGHFYETGLDNDERNYGQFWGW